MRIAVTGTTGQVVTSIVERGTIAGHEVVPIGRPDIDLENPATIASALAAVDPDVIVAAAAYTAVDKAESEPLLAHAVNGTSAGAVAEAAKVLGVPLIHISTDYVFDGRGERPYRETDPTGPNGVYGASKLAGEQAVLAAYPENSVILRVAWVYSPFGANFVKTMLRLAAEREEIAVVADQIGNPTSALDIADGILQVASTLRADQSAGLRGVFHMTAHGEASWAEFAESIFAASTADGGRPTRVRRIATHEYPTPATRPANSRLDCARIAHVHGVSLPDWREGLAAVLPRLQTLRTDSKDQAT